MNGYKISEKIISANKELFENEEASLATTYHLNGKLLQRHVTFRTELEDFEPDLLLTDDYEHEDDEPYEESDIGPDDDLPLDSSIVVEIPSSIVDDYCDKMNEIQAAADEPSPKASLPPVCLKEIDEICEEIEEVILDKLPTASDMDKTATHQSIDDDRFSSLTDDSLDTNSVIAWQSAVKPECLEKDTVPENVVCKEEDQRPKTKNASSIVCQSTILKANGVRPNSSAVELTAAVTDLPRIPLNFKPCCEYKSVESEKLPRYGGYLSQYGLSKAQLERRDAQHERMRHRRCVTSAKRTAEESMKSQINEQAFARWLRNKMRTAHSLTRNMYDYVATNGGTAAKKKRQSSTVAGRNQMKKVV